MSASTGNLDDLGGLEPPPDDMLAAEYALGVLDTPQRLAVETRLAADPPFAALVMAWQRRLVPLAWGLPPVEVPAQVWTGIQNRLGWGPAAAADVGGLGRRLRLWRFTAAFAATAAVALVAVDLAPRWKAPAPVPAPAEAQASRPVTPLVGDDGSAGWLAAVDARRGTVLMVPVPRAPDAQGRAAELWLIPPGQPPRSLGAVSVSRTLTVDIPQALRPELIGGAVLAVSLEPPTGIPHAAPSGPIIAKGAIHL